MVREGKIGKVVGFRWKPVESRRRIGVCWVCEVIGPVGKEKREVRCGASVKQRKCVLVFYGEHSDRLCVTLAMALVAEFSDHDLMAQCTEISVAKNDDRVEYCMWAR